jgi:hypothetical protein
MWPYGVFLVKYADYLQCTKIKPRSGQTVALWGWECLTAFAAALASAFLAAGVGAALQAAHLAGVHGALYAIRQDGLGAAFAVCFGSDFVGHNGLQ